MHPIFKQHQSAIYLSAELFASLHFSFFQIHYQFNSACSGQFSYAFWCSQSDYWLSRRSVLQENQ